MCSDVHLKLGTRKKKSNRNMDIVRRLWGLLLALTQDTTTVVSFEDDQFHAEPFEYGDGAALYSDTALKSFQKNKDVENG